jgi:protein-S-isoprenylcysteine O-methyltransferase Ste14
VTKTPKSIVTWKHVLRGVIGLAVFVAILFVPAGRWDWVEGWAFLIATTTAVTIISVWGVKADPELMKERTRRADDIEGWDKTILRIYSFLLFALLIVASLDAGRFGLSRMPFSVYIIGWLGLAAALLFAWWALASNTYASQTVRIQSDRGHQVVTAGPYRFIRHPMYVGVILSVISIPLILKSWWALIPAALIVILFFIRTGLEDRTLKQKLTGYTEYAERVRYRLLPGVW